MILFKCATPCSNSKTYCTMKTLFYTLLASVLLSACSCRKNEIETFTISGKYLKNYELAPIPNEILKLFAVGESSEDPSDGKFLGQALTASDGSFSIEYEQINLNGYLSLVNENNKEVYRRIPVNQDINQTIFEGNFTRNIINVLNKKYSTKNDTLLISVGMNLILNQTSVIEIPVGYSNTGNLIKTNAVYLILDSLNYEYSIEVLVKENSLYGSYYSNTKNWMYGIGYEDFFKSYNSGNTINGFTYPEGYNKFGFDSVSTYPVVNEYTLVIE